MPLLVLNVLRWFAGKLLLWALIFVVGMLLIVGRFLFEGYIGSAEDRVNRWQQVKNEAEANLQRLQTEREELESAYHHKKEELERAHQQLEQLEGILSKLKSIFNPSEREDKIQEHKEAIEVQELENARIEKELSAVDRKRDETGNEISAHEDELKRAKGELENRRESIDDFMKVAGPGLRNFLIVAIWIVVVLTLLPWVCGILSYYLFGPWVERAPPLLFGGPEGGSGISATPSQPSTKIQLSPADEMVAKEEFLQGSQENLKKSTCWVWTWRYPFTCLACGLVMLTRIRSVSAKPGAERSVTLSHQEEGMKEVARISIPAEKSLVIRPSFIAGLVYPRNRPPSIRSVWKINRLHSWVTLQFRYFVIEGPVDLIVAAGRGVQQETPGECGGGIRINRNLTVAFSPTLSYSSLRAETLMAYLRKKNPLFDDYFQGEGVVYNQQVATGPGDVAGEKFWSRVLSGLGKVIGV